MGTRLNKYIAECGFCSRRHADELITQGRVRINSIIAKQGAQVEVNDIVTIDGKALTGGAKNICLLLHKPIQVVSTAKDPEGRMTVLDLLPPKYKDMRLYPVGRLDYFSEGLIILTNDGDLANTLMHPKHDLPRVYNVRVRNEGNYSIEEILDTMARGMRLNDGTLLAPVQTEIFAERMKDMPEYDIEFVLYQGVNRQIRRMCQESGLVILRLMRVAHGPLSLGNLAPEEVYELSEEELYSLKQDLKYT